MATITCIIPVHNQAKTLQELLQRLHSDRPSNVALEVIVVDDASSQPIQSLCSRFDVVYIRTETNRGPAAARNIGAAAAGSPILFFMDADIEYEPGVLEKALHLLDQDRQLAAVSFMNQPFRKGDTAIKNYGALLEYYWFSQYVAHQPDPARIRGFTTRNGAVRKSAFDAVHGFNQDFQTNAIEDYDFGKRLSGAFPVCLTGSPRLYHHFPDSLLRVLRNYWVRTVLWMAYYLQNKPALDPVQTSKREASACLAAVLWVCFSFLGLVSAPGTGLWTGAAFLAGAYYLFHIYPFLRLAKQYSGTSGFAGVCLLIHLISSGVICVAAAFSLCLNFRSIRRSKARGPTQ